MVNVKMKSKSIGYDFAN